VRWLIDNNIPRSVTWLLLDRGAEAVEVRAVLAHDAPDAAVAAYAAAEDFVLVTHDRALARRCLGNGVPHLWLRTPEPKDAERIGQTLPAIEEAFDARAVRVTVTVRAVSRR
jgi:predicted nuclease of predicted toxin-antitoxin system